MNKEARGCAGIAPFLLSSILQMGPQNETSGGMDASLHSEF